MFYFFPVAHARPPLSFCFLPATTSPGVGDPKKKVLTAPARSSGTSKLPSGHLLRASFVCMYVQYVRMYKYVRMYRDMHTQHSSRNKGNMHVTAGKKLGRSVHLDVKGQVCFFCVT